MQLLCPVHCFEQKRESVSEAKEKAVANLGWGEQSEQDKRWRSAPLPSGRRLNIWRQGLVLKAKVPLPAWKPCCGCLEVSGCGSASPDVHVKGTGKLSQEDGWEQTCTGVGVCHSTFWDAPRPGFLTYQDTLFFHSLSPHYHLIYFSLTSETSHRARELPYCPLLGAPN